MNNRYRLLDMKAGDRGIVCALEGGGHLRHRLESMGLHRGAVIEKVAGSPFGGPVIIRINHIRLAIGYGMAGRIIVEVN